MHWTSENENILWRTIFKTHLMSFHLDRIIAEWPGDEKPTPQAVVEKFETYRDKGNENQNAAASSNTKTITQPKQTGTNDKGTQTQTSTLAPSKSTAPTMLSTTSSASLKRALVRAREHEQIEHRYANGRKRPREDPTFFSSPSKRIHGEAILNYIGHGWRTDCEGYDCGRWHCVACVDQGEGGREMGKIMRLEDPKRCSRTYKLSDCGGGSCGGHSCWSCVPDDLMLYATGKLTKDIS